MTLIDLLIYGDWLKENDIKNDVYKLFLNYLMIKLRKNDNYNASVGRGNGNGRGHGVGYGSLDGDGLDDNPTMDYSRGNGVGSGGKYYGYYRGNGGSI